MKYLPLVIIILLSTACNQRQQYQRPELIDVWNNDKVRARRPLLIAHRGGVVTNEIPECSKKVVEMAAAYRYDMVELDVCESLDHHPIVFHDENMIDACGIKGAISDFTLAAVTQFRFINSEETVTSLDDMLALCSALNLGVMFDIKSGENTDLFFERIINLIKKYNLDKACMTLGQSVAREKLKGTVLLTLPRDMLEKVKQGASVDLHGYFWFGVPKTWPVDLIKPVQQKGALVIPAINIFRYSQSQGRSEAHHDVSRLLKADVDGFQIDSIYQDYFGRPKIQEVK